MVKTQRALAGKEIENRAIYMINWRVLIMLHKAYKGPVTNNYSTILPYIKVLVMSDRVYDNLSNYSDSKEKLTLFLILPSIDN